MAQHPKDQTWKHGSGVYRRFTLVHFAYALVLTIPAALMMLALDLEVLAVAVVVAEVLAFLLMPHIGWVRRAIDERLTARAQAEASMARAVLLLRMSDTHRRELHALEKIASALRERTDTTHTEGDCLGIERLIELYVRLAIAHRASCTSLEVVGPARLDEEIVGLEARATTEGRPHREWADERLAILRMRREARRAALEEQTAMAHDLAMIGDTLRWMQENCATAGSEVLRAELAFALSHREHDAATLRELSVLRESDFDTSVIRIGREATQRSTSPRPEPPPLRVAVTPGNEMATDGIGIVLTEPPAEAANEEALALRIWPTAREAS